MWRQISPNLNLLRPSFPRYNRLDFPLQKLFPFGILLELPISNKNLKKLLIWGRVNCQNKVKVWHSNESIPKFREPVPAQRE